jgi:hypothetical protein
MTIKPLSLPTAAGIDYANGDCRHFSTGDALDSNGLAVPTRHLANRDNIIADKLNTVIEAVNNTEQLVPLSLVRTILASGDQVTINNYRIPAGFEARVLNAAVTSSSASADAELDIYYSSSFGNSTGTAIVTATNGSEFTGETSFHGTGEFIFAIKNKGVTTLEVIASVVLTMRPLGSTGSLLTGSTTGAVQLIAGPAGPPGPQGPQGSSGVGTAGVNWRGTWNSSNTYSVNDLVAYADTGSATATYICVQTANGIDPTNTSYWNLVAAAGATGATGSGGTYAFANTTLTGDTSTTTLKAPYLNFGAGYDKGAQNGAYESLSVPANSATALAFNECSVYKTAGHGLFALNFEKRFNFKGIVEVVLPTQSNGNASINWTTSNTHCDLSVESAGTESGSIAYSSYVSASSAGTSYIVNMNMIEPSDVSLKVYGITVIS